MTRNQTPMMLCGATALAIASLASVEATPARAMGSWVQGEEADNCANDDGAFDEASFVVATKPEAGARVESGFAVKGCSRTFEGDVQWKLLGRDGSVLASGNTQGGGVDGPGGVLLHRAL